MHSAGNHARISPGPGDSRAQQVLAARRGGSHLEAPRLPRASRLLTQGGFRVWVAGLKCCSQSATQRQPRCGRGPGDGTFKSPPDSSPRPAPFAGRVSSGLTFRLSQRTWPQVQEAQGDRSPGGRDISASPGLALRVPGASDLAVGLFCQEEHVAGQCVEQCQTGPQGCFCSFSSLHAPG